MKKTILLLIVIAIPFSIFTQTSFGPESFNYQAVIRDENGEIISNEFISLRFTLSYSPIGGEPQTISYVETHDVLTNDFGMVNIAVGTGQAIIGDITTMHFGQPEYYLQTEVFQNNTWINLGSQQLLSVPFAERSDIAESLSYDVWGQNGNDNVNDNFDFIGTTNAEAMIFKTNNIERLRIHQTSGNVGIGTDNPGNPADGLGFSGKVLHLESGIAESAVLLMSGSDATAAGTNVTQITHSLGEFYLRNHNPNGSISMACGTGESNSLLVTNSGIEVRNGDNDNPILKINAPAGVRSRLLLQHQNTGTATSDGGALDMFASNLSLVNYESGILQLGTSGAITMTIDNEEQVGIGTSSPQGELHIVGGSDVEIPAANGGYLILGATNSSNVAMDNNEIMSRNNGLESPLYLNADGGNVGINQTGTVSWSLTVNGTAAKPGGGSWTATSDARLKQEVQKYTYGLEAVLNVNPVTYRYIPETGYDNSKTHVGVLAQELQTVAPEMVEEKTLEMTDGSTGEYLTVDPSAFTYMLINAIQDQQEMIEKQHTLIEQLLQQNKTFEARLLSLEAK